MSPIGSSESILITLRAIALNKGTGHKKGGGMLRERASRGDKQLFLIRGT